MKTARRASLAGIDGESQRACRAASRLLTRLYETAARRFASSFPEPGDLPLPDEEKGSTFLRAASNKVLKDVTTPPSQGLPFSLRVSLETPRDSSVSVPER